MKALLTRFENNTLDIVFEWHDAKTPARGWVAILGDVSAMLAQALERCHARSTRQTGIASTAFEIALDQLV